MKTTLIGAAGLVMLAGCTNGSFHLPTPGEVGGSSQAQEKLTEFCAADFGSQPVAALGEWVALYNLIAPALDQEPIDTAGLMQGEAVTKLKAVRSAVCIATMPAPAAVEAAEAAE